MDEQVFVEQDVAERRGIDSPPFEAPIATAEHLQPSAWMISRLMVRTVCAIPRSVVNSIKFGS